MTVEPNGAVRVKKKWDYEELGREKTIDFWVIITNTGTSGETVCGDSNTISVAVTDNGGLGRVLRGFRCILW